IRQSTVTAQYRRAQLKDRRYEVRYGLGQELMREASYRDKFVIALSKFLHEYEAETAREEEKVATELKRKLTLEDRRAKGLRAQVDTDSIQAIVDLIDRFGSSELIGAMLIAYGYARESRNNAASTTEIEVAADDEALVAQEVN